MAEPTALVASIPEMVPFIGPEQLMREHGLGDCIRLGANESPFGPSPRALEAMRDELDTLWCYGDPQSFALRDALARRYSWSIDNLLVGSGIDDLMGLVVRAFVGPDDVVVTTLGTYPTLEYHVVGYGGRAVRASYLPDGHLDFDALLTLCKKHDAKLLYIANPDNPSGTFASKSEVRRIAQELPPTTLLLLDEAYTDFVDDDEQLDHRVDDRMIRLRTFSKAYGLAGARIGYAIGATKYIAMLQKIRLQYGVNRNAQVGALAALADDTFVREVVAQVASGRSEYEALGQKFGLTPIQSHTNFMLFDCQTEQRATNLLNALLVHGVWLRKPGALPLNRYIRATVGNGAMRSAFARALSEVVATVAA